MPIGWSPEENFAETAYWLTHFGRYGSKQAAIRAVMRRKGMGSYDAEAASAALNTALRILERTTEIANSVLAGHGKKWHPELTKSEFDDGTAEIANTLATEFPGYSETNEYMVAFLWDMPYCR